MKGENKGIKELILFCSHYLYHYDGFLSALEFEENLLCRHLKGNGIYSTDGHTSPQSSE